MDNLKISTKLIILVIVSSLIMGAIGLYSSLSLSNINAGVSTMYTDRVVPLRQLKNISDAYAVNVVDAVNKANSGLFSWKKAVRELEKAQEIVDLNWEAYLATKIIGEEKRLVKEAQKIKTHQALDAYNEAYDILISGRDSLQEAKLDAFIKTSLYTKIEPLTDIIGDLIDIQLEFANQINTESEGIYSNTQTSLWFILGIGTLFAVLFSLLIIRSINRSIDSANRFVHKLSEGDLTVEVGEVKRDEIGLLLKNLDKMQKRLQDIIGNIIVSAGNITVASQELSGTSQNLSRGASEQAVSAEEASSSIEEMESSIHQISDSAAETEVIAQKAATNMRESNLASQEAVDAMRLIAEKIANINEIAEKTDLLAINAAVEAARADEHGKGFAVVASEVRSLAERSANAATDIEGVSKSGVNLSGRAGDLLAEVAPEIEKTSRLIQNISMSSREQSSGTKQISTAIQQLNKVTQQNAAAAEEMATSSEELASQAEMLKDIIGFFKVDTFALNKIRRENKGREDVPMEKTTDDNPDKYGVDIKMGKEENDDGFVSY